MRLLQDRQLFSTMEKILLEEDGYNRVLSRRMEGIKKFVFFVVIAGLCCQCSDNGTEVLPIDGSDYFPLKTGTFQVYQVSEIKYNSPQDSTVSSYQLKVSVLDSFTNLELGISYTILREKRADEQLPWSQDSIWTARKDDRSAIMVENNVPIVKLTFPLRDSVSWDANMLNGKDVEEYIMLDVEEPSSDDYGSHNKTVTVLQEYFPGLSGNKRSDAVQYIQE